MNKIDGDFVGDGDLITVDTPKGGNDSGLTPPPPSLPRTRRKDGPRRNRFDELSRLIGKPAAQKLVERYGGRRINVPSTMPPRHGLAQTIGHAKAKLLARAYGGTWLVVPVGSATFQKKKQDRALVLLAEGKTIKDIARMTGLSERSVQRLKAKIKATD